MTYLLRNDDVYTVGVSFTGFGTFLCEVHHGLDRLVHHEFETAKECLDLAGKFVDGHVSSRWLWALNADSTSPPLVRPKSAVYTAKCRDLVVAIYPGKRR